MPFFRPHRKRPDGAPPLGSAPTAITRRALDSALASARSAYPNEFGGVFRADPPGVISELLLLPGTTAGHRHANFRLSMLPADLTVVGTVHSHPSGALHPSEADLQLFRNWGRRHLILGAPFDVGCWRAYDGNGVETRLAVVGAPAGSGPGVLRTYRGQREATPAASAPGEPLPADQA